MVDPPLETMTGLFVVAGAVTLYVVTTPSVTKLMTFHPMISGGPIYLTSLDRLRYKVELDIFPNAEHGISFEYLGIGTLILQAVNPKKMVK